jgi:hypothetical protein
MKVYSNDTLRHLIQLIESSPLLHAFLTYESVQ